VSLHTTLTPMMVTYSFGSDPRTREPRPLDHIRHTDNCVEPLLYPHQGRESFVAMIQSSDLWYGNEPPDLAAAVSDREPPRASTQ
jgi:hypothetical protein